MAWYGGSLYEHYTMLVARPLGPYALLFWLMLACNVLTPQLFWSARLRTSVPVLLGASVAILVGMWLERFIIIVASLNRDFLPSAWHIYRPTWVDLTILGGSICFFAFNFLLFVRFLPFIPISELRELRHQLAGKAG
jgi:molybdopterin-containing oxidoreductase family membrane subunit